MFKKIDLKNKTALVTGAGKGLGKACAIALAEAGAKVIIISRTLSDLTKVEKLIKKTKGTCLKFECDVTDLKNMEYLVELNMKAAFNVAQICSQKMVKSKDRKKIGGSIINMSSQLGRVGAPIRSVYNMTKFGLEGLTRGMAIELAKYNIRVNSVCPTFVETPMVKVFFENKKFKKQVLENIPLGRVAQENDVSTAVAFLAADSANSITGTSLMVDGGWTAK